MEVDVQTTARPKRKHSPEFKAEVIRACSQPGVSIRSVARDRGLNPSLVRHWLTGRVYGKGAGQEVTACAPQAPTPSVIVDWPAQEAAACGAWLREWLR